MNVLAAGIRGEFDGAGEFSALDIGHDIADAASRSFITDGEFFVGANLDLDVVFAHTQGVGLRYIGGDGRVEIDPNGIRDGGSV